MRFTYFLIWLQQPQNEPGWWTKKPRSVLGSRLIQNRIGLSMVLRLRQHNIGYTADGCYRSDDPTNSVKALKEGG